MVLRITRGRFDPARYDEFLAVAQEVPAAVSRMPGFQSYQLGVDRAAGTAVAVTVFDTREHAQFPREGLGDVLARLQALGAQLEPPEIYDIAVQS